MKFESIRVVLVATSHPGNIGSAARAMKTMGFSELVLVNPRVDNVLEHEEAIAFASGAQDVIGIDDPGAERGGSSEGVVRNRVDVPHQPARGREEGLEGRLGEQGSIEAGETEPVLDVEARGVAVQARQGVAD